MSGGMRVASWLALALVACCVGPAAADDRPVVFVHGLKSSPATWEGAAGRLAGGLAIQPQLPHLSWQATFEHQANELQGHLWWLPSSTLAIGHSNGGIVARQWSRQHPVGGLVTLGSPNQGAPLVGNLPLLAHYQSVFGWLVSDVHAAFAACCDWQGVWPTVEWWMAVTYWLGDASLKEVLATLGVSIAAPVVPQMHPSSSFLRDLNGANASREAADTPARVAIVSIAANFYDLGIFGAVGGAHADYFNALQEGAVWVLDFYALQVLARADPFDTAAIRKANRLWNLASWIASWDETWCRAVSVPGAAFCTPNDSVVPSWSQLLPGPGAHVLDWGWWGPRHNEETSSSDDKLYQALTAVMRVPARGAPSASAGGSSSGGGSSDSGSAGLRPGESLSAGLTLYSASRQAQLTYQQDGNLVVYRRDGTPLWASHTAGTRPGEAVMQWDGNLVIYDTGGRPVWSSRTDGHTRAWLSLQDDGVMVIHGSGGGPVWSSGW